MIATRPPERRDSGHAWEWQATGTRWRLHHAGGLHERAAAAVARAVAVDELRWSRFRAGSEVSELTRRAGRPTHVSDETFALLQACVRWTAATDGVFQPLTGGALAAWGYGRSLAEGPAGAPAGPEPAPLTGTVTLDPATRTACIPDGTALDLGGIAKVWIAVRAGRLLAARSDDERLLLDAGGDLVAVRGEHLVTVDDAGAGPAAIVLPEGHGAATSGPSQRRWRNGDGTDAHHLIDPRTGAPATAAHATVVAPDPVAAEIWALVAAVEPGAIDALDVPARVSTAAGVRANAAWEQVAA